MPLINIYSQDIARLSVDANKFLAFEDFLLHEDPFVDPNITSNNKLELDFVVEAIGSFTRKIQTQIRQPIKDLAELENLSEIDFTDFYIKSDHFYGDSPFINNYHPDWINVHDGIALLSSTPENQVEISRENENIRLLGGSLALFGSIISSNRILDSALRGNISIDLSEATNLRSFINGERITDTMKKELQGTQISPFKRVNSHDQDKFIGYVAFKDEQITNGVIIENWVLSESADSESIVPTIK